MDKRQLEHGFSNAELNDLTHAKIFATITHYSQKYGDRPYIEHVEAVVNTVKAMGYLDTKYQIVAWLHDCVEDSSDPEGTSDYIRTYFSDEIYQAVLAISKVSGEGAVQYINRVGANRLALIVKLADNTVNYHNSIIEYLANSSDSTADRVVRYGEIRGALEDFLLYKENPTLENGN